MPGIAIRDAGRSHGINQTDPKQFSPTIAVQRLNLAIDVL
jgi:hypothetical protein